VCEKVRAKVTAAATSRGGGKFIFSGRAGSPKARSHPPKGGRLSPVAAQSALAERFVSEDPRRARQAPARLLGERTTGRALGRCLRRRNSDSRLRADGTSPILTAAPPVACESEPSALRFPASSSASRTTERFWPGPNVMQGYYHRPDETSAAIRTAGSTPETLASRQPRLFEDHNRRKSCSSRRGGIAPQRLNLSCVPTLSSQGRAARDKRHFPAVLIVPDFTALGPPATVRPWTSFAARALSISPTCRHVPEGIEAVNASWLTRAHQRFHLWRASSR
jgi:hypothetical protein